MTLTDTGPLVAILVRSDTAHARCVAAAKTLPGGAFVTTWPCFTEAMHFVFRADGYSAQAKLWGLAQSGRLRLHDVGPDGVARMIALMEKYQDTPMDLADASLVATAEELELKKIFTLDNDFRIYRLKDGSALEVVP